MFVIYAKHSLYQTFINLYKFCTNTNCHSNKFGKDKLIYDANGNMTTRLVDGVSYTLAYNEENRIETVTDTQASQTWTFHYDGNGTRVRQVNPDGSQLLLLNGGRYHVEIAADSTESTTRYYSIAGQRPAMRNDNGSINYLLGDHLGSVSTVVNASGEVVSQSRYLPFGELLWEDGTSPTNYTYTGQRSLSDIGLMDYNARFYDPMLGRFTSPDSIIPDPGSVIGYNRYAYVNNNPMIYTDPSGNIFEPSIYPGGGGTLGPIFATYVYDEGGHTYAALHNTTSEKVAENFNKTWEVITIAASVFIEPIDYMVTAKECLSGQCSVLGVAGAVLPFVSGSVLGRLDDAFDVARVVDKAGDAGRTTDTVADSSKALTWNGFRTANKGQYTMAGLSEAWSDYKKANGIITPDPFDGIHGNSLNTTRTNYGYQLISNVNGEIVKFGETLSPNTRYTKKVLESWNATMEVVISGSKYDIHRWQIQQIAEYFNRFDEMPLHNINGK